MNHVEQLLIDTQRNATARRVSERIVRTFFADGTITFDVLVGKQRNAKIAVIRRLVYRELRSRGWSFPIIGRVMHRDHSSILEAVKRPERVEPKRVDRLHSATESVCR